MVTISDTGDLYLYVNYQLGTWVKNKPNRISNNRALGKNFDFDVIVKIIFLILSGKKGLNSPHI